MKFQAKDIQEMLGIPKHRYEYIAMRIGIKPDVEEVEGTGRAHSYSLRNALQFAFVHYANQRGLPPSACRDMLKLVDGIDQLLPFPIYDPVDVDFDLRLHFFSAERWEGFVIDGNVDLEPCFRVFDRSKASEFDLKNQLADFGYDMDFLSNALAYLTVYLSGIKQMVVKYMTKIED